jgi:hypothetical protein
MSEFNQEGLAFLKNAWSEYLAQPKAEQGPSDVKKVLLTAFGLFNQHGFNYSSQVLMALADPHFFAEKVNFDVKTPGHFKPRERGSYPRFGALFGDRYFKIQGERIHVRLLHIDVLWDLAPGIILAEASRYMPDFIFMTGLGGTKGIFEAGALNFAKGSAGYDYDGILATHNMPTTSQILPTEHSSHELKLSWNPAKIMDDCRQLIADIPYPIEAATGARQENTYICNQVSYVAQYAAEAKNKFHLMARRVAFNPLESRPITGFMHYPQISDMEPALIRKWCLLLCGVMKSVLDQ